MTEAADHQPPVAAAEPTATEEHSPDPPVEEDTPFPDLHVAIDIVCGIPIPAELAPTLTQLYQNLGVSFEKALWVTEHTDGMLQALKSPLTGRVVHHPLEAGYRSVPLPSPIAAALQGLSKVITLIPGIRVENHHVIFPNGARRALSPIRWQAPDGRTAIVYQIKRLPDHRWLRVSETRHTGDYDFEDKKVLKSTIEQEIATLESKGYVQIPTPSMTPPLKDAPLVPPKSDATQDKPFSVTA